MNLKFRHQCIAAGEFCPVPASPDHTCRACGDTHTIRNQDRESDEIEAHRVASKCADHERPRLLPCPCCPLPCRRCARGSGLGLGAPFRAGAGRGAYCRSTPCACACHRGGRAKPRAARAKQGPRSRPFDWQPNVASAAASMAAVAALQRLHPPDSEIVILAAVVNPDGTGEITLALRAALEAAERECEHCLGTGKRHEHNPPSPPRPSYGTCYHCDGKGKGNGREPKSHRVGLLADGRIDASRCNPSLRGAVQRTAERASVNVDDESEDEHAAA